MNDTVERREDGFELGGLFYGWHVSDGGKDLMLIDSFARMPVAEFFETIEDEFDRGRAPILLAMIATSVRAKHPDWSVQRIERLVLNTPLSEIEFVDSDAEAQLVPPAEGGLQPPASTEPSNGSSSSSTPKAPLSQTDETLSETPLSSSSPGSPITSPDAEALST